MRIGIDIDNVVSEFVKGYFKYYNSRFGTSFEFEDAFSFHLSEVLKVPEEQHLKNFQDFYESDDFDKMEVLDGAIEAITGLSKENELFFITSRPEKIREKTELFLKKYFSGIRYSLVHSGDYFEGNKTKAEICSELGIDFLVEDCGDYAVEAVHRGIKVFLMNKPWNRKFEECENLLRVNNWKEIMEKLRGVK